MNLKTVRGWCGSASRRPHARLDTKQPLSRCSDEQPRPAATRGSKQRVTARRLDFSQVATPERAMASTTAPFAIERSAFHAPAAHGASLDSAEDHVLDEQTEEDHRQQPGEHLRDPELVLVLEDVPPEAARARAHSEHELRGDQRAPRERPTDLEPREDARERAWDQDPCDVTEPEEAVV